MHFSFKNNAFCKKSMIRDDQNLKLKKKGINLCNLNVFIFKDFM